MDKWGGRSESLGTRLLPQAPTPHVPVSSSASVHGACLPSCLPDLHLSIAHPLLPMRRRLLTMPDKRSFLNKLENREVKLISK